jgi:hypothetical protein
MKTDFINSQDTLNVIYDYISHKKGGIYLRFGDGDFNLAQNMSDLLSRPSPLLQNKLRNAMSIRDDSVLICIPHHCKELNTVEHGMYPGHHEYAFDQVSYFINILKECNAILPDKIYTNVALSYCSYFNPELIVQLHNEIKKYPVLFIGNKNYSDDFLIKLFGKDLLRIHTSDNNAFDEYNNVFTDFDNLYISKYNTIEYFIIIIASGCASRAFSYDLYNKYYIYNKHFYLFDYGSLLDYLNNWNTRAYHQFAPPKKDYILDNIN